MLILQGRLKKNYPHDEQKHIKETINFSSRFNNIPCVQLSILKLDMYSPHEGAGSTTRYVCRANDISEKGFTLDIRTWGLNKIYGIHVEWMAIGEAAS